MKINTFNLLKNLFLNLKTTHQCFIELMTDNFCGLAKYNLLTEPWANIPELKLIFCVYKKQKDKKMFSGKAKIIPKYMV